MNPDKLVCIDLDIPILMGFRKFISSWFYQGDGYNLLVDPGPLNTIPHLCGELRRIGVSHLDYILLTHIHIDHAGGAGALLKEYPQATVICHQEGICHMVAPERLWESSRNVLGDVAEAYGEIVPVPAERIRFEDTIGATGVKTILTPGHAQHHCSFMLDDFLFAGEVAGVRYDLDGGVYLRPATPPRFILEVALESLDRVIALRPRAMAFGHYGMVDNALEHLEMARSQLLLWVKGVTETGGLVGPDREMAFHAWIKERDAWFGTLHRLPSDIRVRERNFVGNTLRGMIGYVDSLTN